MLLGQSKKFRSILVGVKFEFTELCTLHLRLSSQASKNQENSLELAINHVSTSQSRRKLSFLLKSVVACLSFLFCSSTKSMAQYFNQPGPGQFPGPSPYGQSASAQNLQFYPSSYTPNPVSGHATPSQASYGYGAPGGQAYGAGYGSSFGAAGAGVSGRMGEQGGLRTGLLAALGTEGYDGEPPLLEELGVNFEHIRSKVCLLARPALGSQADVYDQTLAVLNPLARIDQHIMDDSDLAGPIFFLLLFATFLLFSGKVHFGYIYGLALLGSIALHTILSLMSPPHDPSTAPSPHPSQQSTHLSSTLTFPRSASVLGYCLLPLVLTSLVGIVWSMDTLSGYVLTSLAVGWCTYSSSGMFVVVGRMRGMRGLVAYPLALFYVGFGIMGIFSSRDSKVLAGGKI